ncbi:PiggyBac transposase Uribo1 [Elysia marginata]|uniref:PiggyBac transposase Uribo1 n=1 Tax=Elysia marginata TaxID=1093978 RepID=A0AAV4GCP2_9GAST|nr:PiggyBac transposase Uribo1 [Elysia marginata]
MAAQQRFRPCLSTSQALLEVLNDADSNDEDLYNGNEPEDEELDLELDLDQLSVPRILRDYHNDSDDEPGPSNVRPRSRSRSRSTSRGDSPVIGVDIKDSDNYEPPTARRRINNSRSRSSSTSREQSSHADNQVDLATQRGRGTGRGRGRANNVNRPSVDPLVSRWEECGPNPPNEVNFTGHPDIKVNTEGFSPADYFELFVDDDLLNHLVTQTNLYADQYKANNPELPQFSRVHEWTNIDKNEIKRFLALVLLTGIVKMPSISHYWKKSILYKYPIANLVMPRNRFQLILKFIHFNDNSQMAERNDPTYDRLYKIRPIVDHLFERFQSVYELRKDVCVDESLLLWKGRLIFCQYIPNKRSRFGIKLYLCCESDGELAGSGGYCYRFKIYTGKEDRAQEMRNVIPEDAQALSISEQTVVFMTLPLINKGYTVYMDNWYSSVRLYLYLLGKNTLACGTVRQARGIPPQIVQAQPSENSSTVSLLGDNVINATKYMSTKIVYMLSTSHGNEELAVPNRRRDGNIRRPKVSAEYNKNMGGVDKTDQLLQPYDCAKKSLKWTKKLFFHLCQMSLCNSFLLAKKEGYDKPLLNFIESVILSWLFDGHAPPQPDQTDDEVRCTERHFPAPIPPTENKAKPTRICVVCSKRGIKRKEVRNHCPDCPSKPALCYPDCYRDYHTRMIFWM